MEKFKKVAGAIFTAVLMLCILIISVICVVLFARSVL